MFVCGIVLGVATQWPTPFHVPEWLGWLLSIIFGLSVYWWYRTDTVHMAYRRRAWLGFLTFLIPALGIPIYLFLSRGLRQGSVATLLATVVAAGVIVASALTAMLVVWIQWQIG
jgi:hypothetical protein